MTHTRRKVLGLTAAAAATPILPRTAWAQAPQAVAPAAGRFFSAAEMALLDELTELIVPTDEHSKGARAARVAGYIDVRLAEYDPTLPEHREAREKWKAGLALVDALAQEQTGKPFLDVPAAQRIAVLERLAVRAREPQTDGDRFFAELKAWTTKGYYTSRIGLRDELEYKGNSMLAEFAGTDPASLPAIRQPED